MCETLWGDDWCGPASDTLDINVRTLQRIKSAGARDEPYSAAGGVLRALHELLSEVSALG
jgi:hypothetical protein